MLPKQDLRCQPYPRCRRIFLPGIEYFLMMAVLNLECKKGNLGRGYI